MMNRARSIKDIGNIYLEMQKKVVSESSKTSKQNVIEEAKVKATVPKDTFPRAKDKVKEPKTLKKGGPKNVKGLKKAKKNKKFSQKSKKIDEGSINNSMSIFDKLYEDVMKNDELDINTGIGAGPEGDFGSPEDVVDLETETETETETPESPKELLQQAIDLLQKAVDAIGGEEEVDSDLEDLEIEDSDSEDSDFDETESEDEDAEDEEDEYGMKKETTDIKPVGSSAGHQLQKGGLAAGNVKATTGKAKAEVTDEVGIETGKHPMDHKSELTNPSKNKVGGLKTGKSLFDQ